MSVFGFIGVGNMGGAMAAAAIRSLGSDRVLVSAGREAHARAFAATHGGSCATNEQIVREADFVVLGVKPQVMQQVLQPLRELLAHRRSVVLVSMAAGLTMENICQMAGGSYPVIRIMPNTPCQVGQGLVVYDTNPLVHQEELAVFLQAMAPAGRLEPLSEPLIDAASAVAGCGPAFAFLFAEALADGGVACGLPRQQALTFAAQMLMGSAQLLLQSGQQPGQLKDAVCSPGGSTIQGVRALENGGFRGTVMEAVIAAWKKSKEFAQ